MTVDELVTAYKTDKAAAETQYKGKTVTITGNVAGYTLNTFSVILKGTTAADTTIKCVFSQGDSAAISALELDQSVKVTGTVGDLSNFEIAVTNCSFVN